MARGGLDVIDSRSRTMALALVAAAVAAVATARVAATHRVFTHTSDEPAHVAAGLEILTFRRYTYELQHPPIARLAVAVGPWLAGVRSTGAPGMFRQGWINVNSGKGYVHNLALARMGVLPFFIALCALVWMWGRWSSGSAIAGTLAVVVLTNAPPVLAHAGLATTDLPFTAAFVASMCALVYWLERPRGPWRGALLGAACGVSLCTKFSFIPFFALSAPLVAGAWVGAHVRAGARYSIPAARSLIAPVLAAAATFVLVCLTVYNFSFEMRGGFPVPAPSLFDGIDEVIEHNEKGHITYLLGRASDMGHPAFFPIALLVKTPIPILLLVAAGVVLSVRRWWTDHDPRALAPYLVATGVLVSSLPVDINIGVRHVLPIYACFAVGAAGAAVMLWRTTRWQPVLRGAVTGLGVWLVVNTSVAHPDYLAWFNGFAGREPGRILVDSDLDWGQDVGRLADTLRARKITSVSAIIWPRGRLEQLIPDVRYVDPGERPTGWVAIDETLYRRGPHILRNGRWDLRPDEYAWLRAHRPVTWAGKAIRLYWIPDSKGSTP